MDENDVEKIKKKCNFSIESGWKDKDSSHPRHCALATEHKIVNCKGTHEEKIMCPFWKP